MTDHRDDSYVDPAHIEVGVIDRDSSDNTYRRTGTPYVWWDDHNDQANPGWVLRTFICGDVDEEIILDAADRGDPDAAIGEAQRILVARPTPGQHPDDLRASLADAGWRRAQAEHDRADAMVDITATVPLARAAGIGVSEIAAKTGLSRRAVYDILAGAPTGETTT